MCVPQCVRLICTWGLSVCACRLSKSARHRQVWSYNRFWWGRIIWRYSRCAVSLPFHCDNRVLKLSIPMKAFRGSVNLIHSDSTLILIREEHWKHGGKQGEALYYALTCSGNKKNRFPTDTHLLYLTINPCWSRGGENNEGKNNKTWNENRKEKEKEHRICILTSHSKLLESRPTTASAHRLLASERDEKTGGGKKEEVGWCEMDQTMDVRKNSDADLNRLQEWRRNGGVW